MALGIEDRLAVMELVALHGHLVDNAGGGGAGRRDAARELQTEPKGIGVNADGTCGSVTYEDTAVRGERGRRIARRKVIARRAPLGAS